MPNTTKPALEASLKKLLLHKPIDKITIADLTADCGISRMSFYYHFKDIYDLVEWVCVEDGKRALQGKKTYDTWQEGMRQIFEAVMENKPFILNVYRGVVEEKCVGSGLAKEDKGFIAEFYKFGFVGIMLDWIDRGMKEDYEEIVRKMGITLYGNITNSIANFEQKQKKQQ